MAEIQRQSITSRAYATMHRQVRYMPRTIVWRRAPPQADRKEYRDPQPTRPIFRARQIFCGPYKTGHRSIAEFPSRVRLAFRASNPAAANQCPGSLGIAQVPYRYGHPSVGTSRISAIHTGTEAANVPLATKNSPSLPHETQRHRQVGHEQPGT